MEPMDANSPVRRAVMSGVLPQGGIAHYSYALAEALQRLGLDTTVLTYREPGYDLAAYPHAHRVSHTLRSAESSLRRVALPVVNTLTTLRALRGAPVLHAQWSLGVRNDRLMWHALRATGKKIVYTAHDVLPHEAAILPLEHCAWLYRNADALIVHSENARDLMLERFGVPATKVHLVPHGNYNFIADLDRRWTREASRASLGYSEKDRVVLFFGLIREYKGLDLLIQACAAIHRRGLPDGQRLRLLIAGRSFRNHWEDANYSAQLRQSALTERADLHLRHIAMDEVARFFRAADVVAVPYRRGSQSGVLQLAHSFAKPAVATRVGGLAEGAATAVTRFTPPGDTAEFEEALFELLASPDAASTLGAQARAYAETELSWEAIARSTRAIYESIPVGVRRTGRLG